MPPLSLDSIRWAQLRHAYGRATDTPALLRRLYESPDDVWSELCGSVVHQGDVSEAAYAVLPHVMAAAKSVPARDRTMHLAFAASALDGRERKPCPDDLRAEYESAVAIARDLAMETLQTAELPDSELPYIFEAIAAANDLPMLARILEQFSNEEFTFICADCESLLYVSTDQTPFAVYAADPVRHRDGPSTQIHPTPTHDAQSQVPSNGTVALPWLRSLSELQGNRVFDDKLICLYGDGECPECGRRFNLYSELEAAEREASRITRKG